MEQALFLELALRSHSVEPLDYRDLSSSYLNGWLPRTSEGVLLMQVFFEPLTAKWAIESGYAKKWDSLITNIKQEDGGHCVTDNRSAADVVIEEPTEWLGDYKTILTPLSSGDVNRFVLDWGDRPTGRSSGFYCSLDKRLYDGKRHRTVHYPILFNEFVEEFSQADACYNFGFMGGITAGLRERIYTKLKPWEKRDNSLMSIKSFNFTKLFDNTDKRMVSMKFRYLDFLRNTKFILCPRGYGVGSCKLFEAMKGGRVPVIISDRYVLPEGPDWSACSVRIRENEIERIPSILESKLELWPRLARNARVVWETNFSDHNFFRYLMNNLEQMRETLPPTTLGCQLNYATVLGMQLADNNFRPLLGRIKQHLMKIVPSQDDFLRCTTPK